jgi:hypothetical protein
MTSEPHECGPVVQFGHRISPDRPEDGAFQAPDVEAVATGCGYCIRQESVMELSTEELKYLQERKAEIQRELDDLERLAGPRYHDPNERRIDLMDELDQVEEELKRADAS